VGGVDAPRVERAVLQADRERLEVEVRQRVRLAQAEQTRVARPELRRRAELDLRLDVLEVRHGLELVLRGVGRLDRERVGVEERRLVEQREASLLLERLGRV